MNPSPLTIGVVMIGVAAIGVATTHAPLTLVSTFAAPPLVAGGLAMLLRRGAVSFWIGLASGAIAAVAGAAGVLLHRQVGLPLEPLVVLVAGLYVCFRVILARRALEPAAAAPPRRSIADDLVDDLADDERGGRS